MDCWRSVKVTTPTNRSDHRGVPRTKIEHTISLRLIHTYGVEDPAGLRHPELGAFGVGEEGGSALRGLEIRSKRGRERGQPFGVVGNNLCVEGVPPSPLFIGERGGGPTW